MAGVKNSGSDIVRANDTSNAMESLHLANQIRRSLFAVCAVIRRCLNGILTDKRRVEAVKSVPKLRL